MIAALQCIIIVIIISVTELGHLLTRSGLTRLKVSLKISLDFFCLVSLKYFGILSFLLWGILFIGSKHFLLYFRILSKTVVIFNSFAKSVFVLYVQMYPIVFLIHFVSAAVILLASLTLMVQFLLPYNRARKVQFYSRFLEMYVDD